jgi:hypothetical protein
VEAGLLPQIMGLEQEGWVLALQRGEGKEAECLFFDLWLALWWFFYRILT